MKQAIRIQPTFFATQSKLREWFMRNHDRKGELWVGFYRKDSGKRSITWPQLVDEALCFGWIDGIRKSIDEMSYMNRTQRKPRSTWSAINIKRANELIELGLVTPAGLAAFEKRTSDRSGR